MKSELPTQQSARPPGVVANLVWISKHRAFRAFCVQVNHVFREVFGIADFLKRNINFNPKPADAANSPIPRRRIGWSTIKFSIECSESNRHSVITDFVPPFTTLNNGSHRANIARVIIARPGAASRMNLTIKMNFGQIFGQPIRRFNPFSGARPKAAAIPIRPHAVKFFGSEPTDQAGLAGEVHRERHVFFGDHKRESTNSPREMTRALAALQTMLNVFGVTWITSRFFPSAGRPRFDFVFIRCIKYARTTICRQTLFCHA